MSLILVILIYFTNSLTTICNKKADITVRQYANNGVITFLEVV